MYTQCQDLTTKPFIRMVECDLPSTEWGIRRSGFGPLDEGFPRLASVDLPPSSTNAAGRYGHAQLAVMLNTHTTRHLERTLFGVIGAMRAAAKAFASEAGGGLLGAIAVALDNKNPEIVDLIRQVVEETGTPIVVTMRTADGQIRLGQLRNNALRALRCFQTDLIGGPWQASALAVFLDGDTIPGPGMLQRYLEASERCGLLIGGRVMMTPEQTEQVTREALLAASAPCVASQDQISDLAKRQTRYQRHLWLRRWTGRLIVKPHKPKPVGGNHAMTFGAFAAINGADETFLGGFQEDDDLARRAFAAGIKPAVLVTPAVAYHQWHPTRQPPKWHDLPNSQRLQHRVKARCEHGLDEGSLPQADLEMLCLMPGGRVLRAAQAVNDQT